MLELTEIDALICRDQAEEASEENVGKGEEASEEYSSEEDDAIEQDELEGEVRTQCIYRAKLAQRFLKRCKNLQQRNRGVD